MVRRTTMGSSDRGSTDGQAVVNPECDSGVFVERAVVFGQVSLETC